VLVTVTDPCLTTLIQSETIVDMSISIYDVLPKTQSYLPFKDSECILQNNSGFCGPKQYVISNPMTKIAPPASSLINSDPWTISAVTNSIAHVGVHVVTVSASLVNYPSVAAKSVNFNLTVIDNCTTA
jgi:hypothetical protein